MSSLLRSIDVTLFLLINRGGQNSFFDWFMPFMTDLKNFSYVLLALGIWILVRERKAGFIFLIFAGLTLAITDQFSSHLLKEWVGRIRPCSVLPDVRLLTDCNTSYSFPSSHAVNIFAAAFFLSQPFRRLTPLFYRDRCGGSILPGLHRYSLPPGCHRGCGNRFAHRLAHALAEGSGGEAFHPISSFGKCKKFIGTRMNTD